MSEQPNLAAADAQNAAAMNEQSTSSTGTTPPCSAGASTVGSTTTTPSETTASSASSASAAPIYSPSRTEDWLRCPVYRVYNCKWQSKDWTPNLLLGRALAVGLERYYMTSNADAAREQAVIEVHTGYVENDRWTLVQVSKMAEQAVDTALIDARRILDTEEIVGVEQTLPSTARPDLITRSHDGLIVTDAKYTLHCKTEYLEKRLAEYETSHQLWHYAWEVSQVFREPVRWVRVHLVVGGPKRLSRLAAIRIDQWRLDYWLSHARWAWEQMAKEVAGGPVLPRWTSCYGKFGRCQFFEGCHDLHRDETQFPLFYKER